MFFLAEHEGLHIKIQYQITLKAQKRQDKMSTL
jgi:hypothetical protein